MLYLREPIASGDVISSKAYSMNVTKHLVKNLKKFYYKLEFLIVLLQKKKKQ